MNTQPLFRLLSNDPKLPFDLRALPPGVGDGMPLELSFAFVYGGLPFLGHYEDDGGVLTLSATPGSMPFSAESPIARAALQAVVGAVNQRFGPVFSLDQGRLVLTLYQPVVRPASAAGLVTAIVTALLPIKPYIDLIATYLVLPGEDGAAAGAGHVRPIWRRVPPRGAGAAGPRRPTG